MSTGSQLSGVEVRSRSFRFGPRETSGVILGLGMGSLLAVFAAVFVLTRLLAHGGVAVVFGLVLVAGTVAAVWVPVADRPVAGWLPIAAAHLTRRALGWSRFRGGPANAGTGRARTGSGDELNLPGELADLAVISVDTPAGPVGVIRDRRRDLYTVVLATEGSAFQLLTPDEQDARLASWGETLAGLANSTAGIVRIHLTDTTVPDCGDALARRWHAEGGHGTEETAASYAELLEAARPVTQKHESHVALVLDPRKARRQIRTLAGWRGTGTPAGSGVSGVAGRDAGAGAYLLQRAVAFADELALAGVTVTGVLPPRGLAKLLRTSYEPGSRWALEARGPANDGGGAAADEAGPAAADASAWSYYRTDDTFHAVYWIAEWPRHDVPGAFLQDLILRTACERTVSVCLQPRDPRRAADEVARKQTAKGADENLRSRLGFGSTARNRREASELTSQDEELADGEALYRFLGLIRLSAPDLESLDRACGDIEIAARNLKLRRLYGEQDTAFNATLPLGRGLRWGWLR